MTLTRRFLRTCSILTAAFVLAAPAPLAARADEDHAFSIVVYGATPAGIAAALAAADDGSDVLLVEPTSRIGGLVTNGLSHSDFRTFPGITGTFLDFTRRVDAHYRHTYGEDSRQVELSFGGTQGEPSVNLMVFEQMLAERPNVTVWRSHLLDSVELSTAAGDGELDSEAVPAIRRLVFRNGERELVGVRPNVCVDAGYEGDLMAAAGVPYHVGREGRDQYGESLAPEEEDGELQAYNFRLVMTTDPDNRVMPSPPPGYDRELFVGVLPILASGQIDSVFAYPGRCIIKAHTPGLPNDKYDMNDVSRGLVRMSLPGENLGWPDGDAETRQKIFDEHRLWNEGIIYFLQNDEAVPESFRKPARQWGWCRDEFTENDHLPLQLYVREARRMIGAYVYTQGDTEGAPGDARSKLHLDAIAMGDYGPNCHGTGREGTRFDGRHTGEFYHPVSPYQIPYGVLTPDAESEGGVSNLLVPGAVSASHVGFCALRLEPIWTLLGQAAGHAAHLAAAEQIAVQEVPVAELQQRLHRAGAATLYVSDVLPGDDDFELVQWWGSHGGFHGLAPAPEKPGQRGPNIVGQYFEPYPNHAAAPDKLLDDATLTVWRQVAERIGIPQEKQPKVTGETTRRQWLKQLRDP